MLCLTCSYFLFTVGYKRHVTTSLDICVVEKNNCRDSRVACGLPQPQTGGYAPANRYATRSLYCMRVFVGDACAIVWFPVFHGTDEEGAGRRSSYVRRTARTVWKSRRALLRKYRSIISRSVDQSYS